MDLLLTSSGITNPRLAAALVELLGKPVSESTALFIPTAIYPFAGGAYMARRMLASPLCELGWKSLGLLELSVLPSIDLAMWVRAVHDVDALLVGGGDPMFLAGWMRRSGLAAVLPGLRAVYVGVSAGSMVASSTFVETYTEPPRHPEDVIATEAMVFEGDIHRTLVTARGLGLVDVALIPHLDHDNHPDASMANAARWASRSPLPTYAIDNDSAIRVVRGAVDVVSAGGWKRFG